MYVWVCMCVCMCVCIRRRAYLCLPPPTTDEHTHRLPTLLYPNVYLPPPSLPPPPSLSLCFSSAHRTILQLNRPVLYILIHLLIPAHDCLVATAVFSSFFATGAAGADGAAGAGLSSFSATGAAGAADGAAGAHGAAGAGLLSSTHLLLSSAISCRTCICTASCIPLKRRTCSWNSARRFCIAACISARVSGSS
jgi:hypothetical protein